MVGDKLKSVRSKINPKTREATASSKKNVFEVLPAPTKRINSLKSRGIKIDHAHQDRLKKYLALVIAVFVIGFGGGWIGSNTRDNNSILLGGNTSQGKEIISSQDELVNAVSNNVSPSVVSIDAIQNTQTQDIFGFTSPTQSEDEGTGIIISGSGYVITNRHVIPSGTTKVTITLADGTTISNVSIVGTTDASDPLDIGFLKINNSPETLHPAVLGDSSKMQVGDSVVAIGNALGQFQNTVTSGIISGRGRTIQAGDSTGSVSEDLQDLIQTDAAINEGNSGGPLVNSNSEVIGINTALASGTAQNIGFAIPINDALGLIKGVLANGKISRPYLGVYYVNITPSVQRQYNLSNSSGAYIPPDQNGQASVISGSPASNAGLQVGDVITAVNGSTINNINSLSSLIDENQVGDKLNLTVIRNGQTKIISVTVGQAPASLD